MKINENDDGETFALWVRWYKGQLLLPGICRNFSWESP